MDEFLTVAEVAEMLKLNPQTIRNWIDAGSLPAYRIGRRVRIGRADFLALIEASTPQAAGAGSEAQAFWEGEYLPTPHTGQDAC